MRSFKLNEEEVAMEHAIFEMYGITDETQTERYRSLIRFLHEGLRKYSNETPPVKYIKPDCEAFTDLQNGKFDCIHARLHAPPKILKNVHLEHCHKCILQQTKLKQQQQQVVNNFSVVGGEIKTKLQSNASPSTLATLNPKDLTPANVDIVFKPNPNYGLAEHNYMRADGSYICPFYTNDGKPIFVHYLNECVKCKKDHPEKNKTCRDLKLKLQNELNQKNMLRTQSQNNNTIITTQKEDFNE